MDTATAIALANEARRVELKTKIAGLMGEAQATASITALLSTTNGDALRRLESARAELAKLEAGAGPGVTDTFRPVSTVDNAALAERNAGQMAVVTLVKEMPETTEAEAIDAWVLAAKQTRPEGRDWLLHDPCGLLSEYQANLLQAGAIAEASWEAFRAWILATPLEQMP